MTVTEQQLEEGLEFLAILDEDGVREIRWGDHSLICRAVAWATWLHEPGTWPLAWNIAGDLKLLVFPFPIAHSRTTHQFLGRTMVSVHLLYDHCQL